MSGGSSNCS